MDKKHIALFSTSFLQYSQTFVYDEIRFHQRYQADVFCNERLNEKSFPYKRVFCPPQNSLCQSIYRNWAYWPAFNRQIKNKKYYLIHAHFGTGAVYCLPYVKKYNIPFMVTFWGNDVSALLGSQRFQPSRWRYLRKIDEILERADLILAVSREMQQILQEYSGYTEKIKLYHHGVDTQQFQPVANRLNKNFRFTLVGRFTQKKGHIYALKAFKQVYQNHQDATLSFIGQGKLMPYCQQFVAQNNMQDAVEFKGVLSHKEVAAYIARSDVVLVPSIVADDHDREGSPTVVKEAGACGVPVIGTCHAGIWETVVDGKTGFLVPERDVNGLADRMEVLLKNEDLRNKMGQHACRHIREYFNARKQVQVLEKFYDEISLS